MLEITIIIAVDLSVRLVSSIEALPYIPASKLYTDPDSILLDFYKDYLLILSIYIYATLGEA